jgi:hypothetical protein
MNDRNETVALACEAASWRERAQMAREIASVISWAPHKRQMLLMAEAYEQEAEHAERGVGRDR